MTDPFARPPLTRQQLDAVGCDNPDCDHTSHDGLYLHSNCHPDAPTWTYYNAVSGTLHVECAECNHVFARIAVSPGPDHTQQLPPNPPPHTHHIGYQACWATKPFADGIVRHCRKPMGHDGPHAYI